MKKFIRTLSMLVCVAMLMTNVPVDLDAALLAYAEDEIVQAVQIPEEGYEYPEESEEIPTEDSEQDSFEAAPEASENEISSGEIYEVSEEENLFLEDSMMDAEASNETEPEFADTGMLLMETATADIAPAEGEIVLGVGELYRKVQGVSLSENEYEYIYTSLNEDVVNVDEATGELIAISEGEAVVEITTKDDLGGKAACRVIVVPGPDKLIVEAGELYLGRGDKFHLLESGFVSLPEGTSASFGFVSAKASYVSVDDKGVVTAHKNGKALIAAGTHNGASAMFNVVVCNPPSSVSVESKLELGVGMTGKLNVTFPANTYSMYKLTGYDEKIISVDEYGRVTGLKAGTTEVIVETNGGLKSKPCKVTVHPAPEEIYASEVEVMVGMGELYKKVQGASAPGTMCEYTYKSLDEKTVKVDAKTGELTAVKTGEAIVEIISKANSALKAECKVKVVPGPEKLIVEAPELLLGRGDKFNLLESGFVSLPEGTSASFGFVSAKASYVSVDDKGVVTAHKNGKALIAAGTHNGASAMFNVVVCNPPSSVSVESKLELGVGMTDKLNVTFPANTYSMYKLTGYDEKIISVDEYGRVTGLKAGTTEVIVETNGGLKSKPCKVTVHPAPEEIYASEAEVMVGMGELYKKVQGASAPGTMCEYTYKSLDEKTVKVDVKTGELTAVKTGEAIVEIVSKANSALKAECKVKVVPGPEKLIVEAPELLLGRGDKFDLLESGFVSLPEGTSASFGFVSAKASYVSVDDKGVVTAHKNGKALIAAGTHNGASAMFNVVVCNPPSSVSVESKLELGVGMTGKLNVTFPSNTYSMYKLTGYDEKIISVDEYGRVTGLKAGTTEVIVETNGGLKSKPCKVTVHPAPEEIYAGEAEVTVGMGELYKKVQGASAPGSMCEYTYKSLDEKIVKVDSKTGELTAVKTGEAVVEIISKADSALKAECKVKVVPGPEKLIVEAPELLLGRGDKFNLLESGFVSLPEGTSASFGFVSAKASYVSVDDKGVLTAHKNGKALIAAGTHNGASAMFNVVVCNPPSSVSVESKLELGEGMMGKLNVTFPANTYSMYKLTGYDDKIISVDEYGRVTGLKAGTTEVIVETNGGLKSKPCKVTVHPAPEEIYAAEAEVMVGMGELYKKVQGASAPGTMCEYTYKSLDEKTVKVDAKTGELTAVKTGEAIVEIISKSDSAIKAECKVKVVPGPETLIVEAPELLLGRGDKFNLLESGFISLPEGTSASFGFVSAKASYVSVDDKGVVTAHKNGKALIAAGTHNGASAMFNVVVCNPPSSVSVESKLELGVGMTGKLNVTFPANTYSMYKLTGYDEKIISVDEYGRVTGLKAGTTEVIVETNGGLKSKSCKVTVHPAPEEIYAAEAEVMVGMGELYKKVQGASAPGTMCEYTYKSLDEKTVKVDAKTGELTAVKTGEAIVEIISGSDENLKAECKVKVVPGPDTIILEAPELLLGRGDKFDLLESGFVSLPEGTSASFGFVSAKASYVSVDDKGMITAHKNGKVLIAVGTHNGASALFNVVVCNPPSSVTVESELTLGVEMTGKLNVTFPANTYSMYKLTGYDEEIISVDEYGHVTGLKAGETEVIVETNGGLKSKPCKVTVLPAPEEIGVREAVLTLGEGQTGVKVQGTYPNETMCGFTYSSSDTSKVKVNAQTGELTALQATGETPVTITVTSRNSVACTASCLVTVTPAPYELVYEDLTTLVIAKGDAIALPDPIALDVDGHVCPSPFTFTSSNPKIAQVNGNVVTGVAAGSVTITVTAYNGANTSFKLTVSSYDITGVGLGVDEKTLYVNDSGYAESVQLSAYVIGTGLNSGSLRYKSDKPDVAEVSEDGLVTAKAPGTAEITVSSYNQMKATAVITVEKLSTSLSFENATERITEGQKLQLEPVFDQDTSAPVRYASMDVSTAVVNEEGLVTALKPGDVTIKAFVDVEGEKTRFDLEASIDLHIIAAPTDISLHVTSVNLVVGESITLEPKLKATAAEFDDTIKFESSDSDVATVDAATGLVTAVGTGEAKITVTTCNGKTAECDVFVTKEGTETKAGFAWETATIVAGDKAELEVSLNKAAFDNGYTITSSNPEKLSVDSDSLVVEALEAGEAKLILTIAAAEGEGEGTSYETTVKVVESTKVSFSATELELRTAKGSSTVDSSATLTINGLPSDLIGTYALWVEDETIAIYEPAVSTVQALDRAGSTDIVLKTFDREVRCKVTVYELPTYRAVIIGEFNGTANGLPFVANNMNAMDRVINASMVDGQVYEKVAKLNNPVKATIQSTIESTFADAAEGDISLVYIVSHGYDVAANGGYHFGIYNYNKSTPSTYVTHSELMDWLSPIKGNVMLVLDSCRSGAFVRDAKSRLQAEGNISVITAQDANRNASFYQGTTANTQVEFLTYAFCEGLGYVYSDKSTGLPKWLSYQPADTGMADSIISVSEILNYTDRTVPPLVAEYMKTFTDGRSKFRVPGVYTKAALNAWGGQDPQVFMPSAMENVAFFGF